MPLAEAGVSVFAVSTFDTDYLLVKDRDLLTALDALHSASHVVSEAGVPGPGQPRRAWPGYHVLVMTACPNLCNKLHKSARPSPSATPTYPYLRDQCVRLKQRDGLEDDPGEFVLPFGPFKGTALGNVETDYLLRLLGQSFVRKSLRNRIERHLAQRDASALPLPR